MVVDIFVGVVMVFIIVFLCRILDLPIDVVNFGAMLLRDEGQAS